MKVAECELSPEKFDEVWNHGEAVGLVIGPDLRERTTSDSLPPTGPEPRSTSAWSCRSSPVARPPVRSRRERPGREVDEARARGDRPQGAGAAACGT